MVDPGRSRIKAYLLLFRYVVTERHSSAVTDVLRYVGLTHGGVEIY